ncbi:MAG: mechanosensitive ion channel [Polyangia bacterium]
MSTELLRINGLFAGAGFVLLLLVALLASGLLVRTARLFLRALTTSEQPPLTASFQRSVRRATAVLLALSALLLGGAAVFTSARGHSLGQLVQNYVRQLGQREWTELAVALLKPLGVLLAAFIASRILLRLLHSLSQRLQQSESLARHRERIVTAFDTLRGGLLAVLLFGSVLLCVQLLAVSEPVRHVLVGIAYLGVAVPLARCAVSTAHLVIDVLFDLSTALEGLGSRLRYLGRLRHLAPLSKRAADYLIYVGVATWTAEQLAPGTWAAQAGRIALRVITIFYLSRVFIEVCLLFLNEFFLNREGQGAAELQQRQTLVPVAASILRYLIYFMAVVMSLREAGLDPTPLLAGAGVAGIAVGLGAQSFVGDIVAGFFILFENLLLVGDLVQIGEVKGKVEEIGVRTTKVRDDEGILHILPNGEVRKISSHSRGYINVIADLPVPYGEDLPRLFDAINQKMVAVREAHPDLIGPTELGIEELRDASILIRTVTMARPGKAEELVGVVRLALWEAMTAARVAPPYTRHVLLPAPEETAAGLPAEARSRRVQAPRADIQKLKAYNLYLALDVDGSGSLEQADVDRLAQRLATAPGRPLDPAVLARLQASLKAYWLEITRSVDRDADGRISREEFLAFCSALSEDLSGPAGDAISALASVLFTAYDHGGSGTLSEQEFLGFTRAHGLNDAAASAGFRLIDRDRNGHISKEEWLRFMRDVFVSRRLNDASAVVFGPGCRDLAAET